MKRRTELDLGEGFADVSAAILDGVYVLANCGRVVYVASARRMMDNISAHARISRRTPKPWFTVPGVTFDRVYVYPCAPDAADRLVAELIAQYRPKHNLDPRKQLRMVS